MNLPDGYLLQNGKYKLTQVVGRGGFGITYKGIWFTYVKGTLGAIRTEVPVCIKEFFFKDYCYRDTDNCSVKVHSETGQNLFSRFREKLIKEAKILSEVHHRYIVNVLEVFEENNTAYIVMEYISGQSLKNKLDTEGPIPEYKVLKYVKQITEALAFLHEKHILHLDIKPSNILLDSRDDVRLIDFGVSKRYDIEEKETSTTILSLSKGFASIEQYDNEGVQNFSPCPDIYSLGATMYNLLTGKIPTESILRVTRTMPSPRSLNPEISENTEKVILKSMEIVPSKRYQSVNEMVGELDFSILENADSRKTGERNSCSNVETYDAETELINLPAGSDEDETMINTTVEDRLSASGKDEAVSTMPKSKKNNRKELLLSAAIIFMLLFAVQLVRYVHQESSSTDERQVLTDEKTVMEHSVSAEENGKENSMTASVESRGIIKENSVTQDKAVPIVADREYGNSSSGLARNNGKTVKKQIAVSPEPEVEIRGNTFSTEETRTGVIEDELEKQYRDFVASGRGRMKAEDYPGAKADFISARNIKITEEVVRLIIECDEKAEAKNVADRISLYERKMYFGKYIIVRKKENGKYGAIDENGNEKIPCRYLSVGLTDKGRAFERTDNLFDIYDSAGNIINGDYFINLQTYFSDIVVLSYD